MHVSRCRYWWCPKCQAAFEKEDLAATIRRHSGRRDAVLLGTRTCRKCGAAFLLRDIYAGKHDAPRQSWGQLRPPVELPPGAEDIAAVRVGEGPVRRPSRSALTNRVLSLLLLGAGLALLGYVLLRPFFGD
jgi:hypothetical protein